MSTEVIGWASSVVLVLTLIQQVRKQHKSRSSEGVSKWLFAGQLLASIGFTIYSVLVANWVFVVTNSILIVNAVVGFAITFRNRARDSEPERDRTEGRDGSGRLVRAAERL